MRLGVSDISFCENLLLERIHQVLPKFQMSMFDLCVQGTCKYVIITEICSYLMYVLLKCKSCNQMKQAMSSSWSFVLVLVVLVRLPVPTPAPCCTRFNNSPFYGKNEMECGPMWLAETAIKTVVVLGLLVLLWGPRCSAFICFPHSFYWSFNNPLHFP